MGRTQTGIHQDRQGFWCVDRIYKGTRLRNRFESFEEAEGMTAHYSVAQIDELVGALNRIADERNRVNRSLAMILRERLETKSPQEVPVKMKMG